MIGGDGGSARVGYDGDQFFYYLRFFMQRMKELFGADGPPVIPHRKPGNYQHPGKAKITD